MSFKATQPRVANSLIPQLELARRQSLNALAVLLGIPPGEADAVLPTTGVIPEVPSELMVGIPAELICRRPTFVRRSD